MALFLGPTVSLAIHMLTRQVLSRKYDIGLGVGSLNSGHQKLSQNRGSLHGLENGRREPLMVRSTPLVPVVNSADQPRLISDIR
jgi:hypothetical protein